MNENKKIIELEISRPGSFGSNTAAVLMLPATPYELADALDRARVIDEKVIYSIEILSCDQSYLPQFISQASNLYELNHLAQSLAVMSDWDLDCLEGMVLMEAARTANAPIPVDRLINMADSRDHCQVVYEADDDTTLGKFYADNDFIPQLENLPYSVYKWLDFSKIGKEMREGEGGVFTTHGYVVQNGEISQAYQSGDAILRQKPEHMVLLRMTKGGFNDLDYDNDLSTLLKLPASDQELFHAVGEVGAASPEECTLVAVDCIIPQMTEKITDELKATDGDCYGLVNELAEQFMRLNREGGIPICKAMLMEAPEDISLEEVLDLACQTDGFSILREAITPTDYAEAELLKCAVPLREYLFADAALYHYGEKLMEHNKAALTDYGILITRNGQTVEQCLNRFSQSMEMR